MDRRALSELAGLVDRVILEGTCYVVIECLGPGREYVQVLVDAHGAVVCEAGSEHQTGVARPATDGEPLWGSGTRDACSGGWGNLAGVWECAVRLASRAI